VKGNQGGERELMNAYWGMYVVMEIVLTPEIA